ncbi:hypothetical protein [Bradyrhizobium sp. 2S1]|uniref:hypothetical protein n=1 Tax=Bradyrhizobium sp. 2S1 TaxID=1404429 RepID=UPI001595795D|nr:hypothetical protein [Bradyrhizobium sp. 2S1]MCK7664637.1 hypothetical protein [Bradyrhizobium sp. 2S1]
MAELFNNIQDHTQLDIGTICAQHFPRESLVYISLSDMGLGIPGRVRTLLPQLSDAQAIIKATEAGFTTKTTPGNRGIGSQGKRRNGLDLLAQRDSPVPAARRPVHRSKRRILPGNN